MSRTREIIQHYFGGRHSEDARKKFASWLKASANRAEKEAALRDIWNELEIEADTSTEQSYEALMSTIRATNQTSSRKRFTLQKFYRMAAIFMLPVLSVAITYFLMKDYRMIDTEINLVECIVPNGEIRTIVLPDSSVIKVNSGSVLIYPEQFGKKRDVFLNGEAYFHVARDESKPFIVKTTDMDVEVLGTVFNISSYADDEFSSATLESGSVNVLFKSKDKGSMLLHPNEQVSYNREKGTVEKNQVKMANVIAWTQGNLVIQSMSMDEIARIIERKFALTVNLNAQKYKNERITMKATHGESITDFMNILSYLVPQLKYRIENETLFIY